MKYLPWLIILILLAVLLRKGPEPVEFKNDPLQAENDSLLKVIEARDMRDQLRHEAADSLRNLVDSLVANAPSARTIYIRWHADVAHWSTDSLWQFMGTMPADADTSTH